MPENQAVPENTLGVIVEELSSYLKKFSHFKDYEKDIKKYYKKYYGTTLPDRWPVEFINRACEKTRKMQTTSGRRKCWSLAILFQAMERSKGYDVSETEEETEQPDVKEDKKQSGADPSANKPVYIRIPFSEMSNKKHTDEKDKEGKAPKTVEKKSVESPQKETQYKLLDKVPSPTQILQKNSYITLYDNQTRNAAWVYEILHKSPKPLQVKSGEEFKGDNKTNYIVKRKYFKEDNSVHSFFQPSTATYPNIEYNRGHLAAAGNHKWCQEAYNDTYVISNVIPQQCDFNSGIWSDLEKLCREIAKREEVRNVHVYTGPLYLSTNRTFKDNNDKEIFEKRVEYEILGGKAVPTHLFKVIIVENNDGTVLEPECYKIANERETSQNKPPIKKVTVRAPQVRIQSKKENILREQMGLYEESMENIQRDSGLIFEEREIKEEMTEGIWKVHKRKGTLIEVRVSSSY